MEHSFDKDRAENMGAVAVELTADDLHDIESAAAQITVQGARYPENLERQTNRSAANAVFSAPASSKCSPRPPSSSGPTSCSGCWRPAGAAVKRPCSFGPVSSRRWSPRRINHPSLCPLQ